MANDFIMHYGVEGMKWGVRRYQNEDGTLTPLGKEHYYSDSDRKAMFEESKKHIVKSNSTWEGSRTIDTAEMKEAGAYLKRQSDKIIEKSNTLFDRSNKYFEDMSKDDKAKKAIINDVKNNLKNIDEPDEWDIEDAMSEAIDKYFYDNFPKDMKKMYEEFDRDTSTFIDNQKAIIDDIVGDFKDMPISKLSSTEKKYSKERTVSYEQAVSETIWKLSDSGMIRYLLNHEDGDLLYNTEKRNLLEEAIKKEWKKG